MQFCESLKKYTKLFQFQRNEMCQSDTTHQVHINEDQYGQSCLALEIYLYRVVFVKIHFEVIVKVQTYPDDSLLTRF